MTRETNGVPGAAKRARIPATPFTLPLTWWRTMKAETFDATTAVVLREAIPAHSAPNVATSMLGQALRRSIGPPDSHPCDGLKRATS